MGDHAPEMVERVTSAIHYKQYGFAGSASETSKEWKWSKVLARAALDASAHHELVEALEEADTLINNMSNNALKEGLEGTSEWDRVAGAANIYGVQDTIRSALAKSRGQS